MREAILWVAEALPKKSAKLPVLNHIHLGGGFAVASNGRVTMAHPVLETFNANPLGSKIVDALKICDDKVAISQLDNGDILIRQKSFNVKIPSSTDIYPTTPSGGVFVPAPFPVRKALATVRKFVSEDANIRPVLRSVYFCGEKVRAASNVSIAEYWHGQVTNFNFAIPVESVDAILSIKEEPYYIELSQTWVKFWYPSGAWVHTPFMEERFPDLDHIFEGDWHGGFLTAPEALWDALDRLKPFLDDTGWITIQNGSMTTGTANDAVPGLEGSGRYVHKYLAGLRDHATRLSVGAPLRWIGENCRGVVYGKVL